MSSPIIKGSRKIHETSQSGRIRLDSRRSVTYVEEGLYAELKGEQKGKGQRYKGLIVESSELERLPGGFGRLTTTCAGSAGNGGSGDAGPENYDSDAKSETIYEVESAQLEKSILAHPEYKGYAEAVDAWRNSGDPAMRAAWKYYDAEGNPQTLDGRALMLAKKIAAGTDTYICFAPVVRVTTRNFDGDSPSDVGSKNGKICDPPKKALDMVDGKWKWLKTGDRSRLSSGDMAVERIEEWTGADEWDTDLYEEG